MTVRREKYCDAVLTNTALNGGLRFCSLLVSRRKKTIRLRSEGKEGASGGTACVPTVSAARMHEFLAGLYLHRESD